MLSKEQKIQGQIESGFFAQASKKRFAWGVLYYQLGPGDEVRWSVIAPKKFLHLSVARHQAKRKVFAAVEALWSQWQPGQYVISVNDRILEKTVTELEAELREFP
ncbi:ribonuclease P protein component [bacterium]|nr:ribonuclease P protein component [bacterium]MBQ6436121.1 ribonuclease P protein component [bacterium]